MNEPKEDEHLRSCKDLLNDEEIEEMFDKFKLK